MKDNKMTTVYTAIGYQPQAELFSVGEGEKGEPVFFITGEEETPLSFYLLGVFSSKEKADEAVKTFQKNAKAYHKTFAFDGDEDNIPFVTAEIATSGLDGTEPMRVIEYLDFSNDWV